MRSHVSASPKPHRRNVFFEGFAHCSAFTAQSGQATLHNLATTQVEARGFRYAALYKDVRSEGVHGERQRTFHYIRYRPGLEAPPGMEFYGVPQGCLVFFSWVTCDLISNSFFR